jgi:hypothetical protein
MEYQNPFTESEMIQVSQQVTSYLLKKRIDEFESRLELLERQVYAPIEKQSSNKKSIVYDNSEKGMWKFFDNETSK